MAVNNNLYPPIVDTYMPAFLINSGNTANSVCRVYFSLSPFNSYEEVHSRAQITVRSQATNLSMLNTKKYPCEIMLKDVKKDESRNTDDKYYIQIERSDMENGFEINQYYKVQIRFTSTDADASVKSTDNPQQIDGWLAANQSLFSEWSTVCLIRGISSPTLDVNGFTIDSINYWPQSNVDLIGTLTFDDGNETETLKNYQIKLYDIDGNLLTDSGLMYSNNYNNINSFNYTLKYNLIEGEYYTLFVEYTTQNLYQELKEYNLMIIESYADKLDADLSYVLNQENAYIGINIKSREGAATFVGNITIRRTSSESNFTIWEDVNTVSITEDQELDYTWYDFTIESGIWYRYCAQKRSSTGQRGVIIELKEPKMLIFDDMFLTGQDRQLKIQFNPTMSSFKRNVTESNTTTIGSKYPFIKRNGYAYYRSFPIGGLISSEIEDEYNFATREEILKGEENVEMYDKYNKEHRIIPEYDFTYEREFREKVEEFLMDNTVKLFRSPTEGNILVKLMDVNFQPNQTLGRRLYSFTATAYEIDDFTVENCEKYSIQSLGEYTKHFSYPDSYFGQLSLDNPIPAGTEILNLIQKKYQQYAQPGYNVIIKNLDFLRLEINNEPWLIAEGNDGPYLIEANKLKAVNEDKETIIAGYLVYINGIPIVINREGRYELTNEGTEITSLYFPADTNVTIDFNANIKQSLNESIGDTESSPNEPKSMTFETVLGQCWGGFSYKDSIIQQIWNKYYEKYSDYGQALYYLNNITVEADPMTVIYVKENKDFDYERHVIGQTCMLDFNDDNANILSLYFAGIHFKLANDAEMERDTVPDYIYKETGITLNEDLIIRDYKYIRNGVYTLTPGFITKHPELMSELNIINSNRTIQAAKSALINKTDTDFIKFMENKIAKANDRYIYYNDKFWLFTEDDDLLCPVEAMINYSCDIIKERYK